MKATLIFSINRAFEGRDGRFFRLFMDLYLLDSGKTGASNLDNYKLSWIFFDSEYPDIRILMDNHQPIGLHLHLNNGDQIKVEAHSLEDAQTVFKDMVKKHFDFDLEV